MAEIRVGPEPEPEPAELRTDQRLGRITRTAGPGLYDDPVVATLLPVSIQAAAFNQHQDPVPLQQCRHMA